MAPVGPGAADGGAPSGAVPSTARVDAGAVGRADEASAPLLVALRALGLGDLLTAVPALRALRRHHPRHRIVLAAPAALAPLAALTGAVDATVDTAPLAPLDPRLQGADVAVNLHGRGPQSHGLLRASQPRRLLAFAEPGADGSGPRWRADEHEVLRWCRMLEAHGIPADPHDLRLPRPDAATPEDARGAVLLHPGAASGSRRWPVERFAAVARSLARDGDRVLVTGSAGEAELAAAVVAGAGLAPEDAVAGRTDLPGLLALVADAACVVCGDTGVAHVATAMGTPSVLLFGPTPPGHWGPLVGRDTDPPRHAVLWAGRTGDPHADEPDPGLLQVVPDEVLRTVAAVRGAGRGAAGPVELGAVPRR